MTVCPACLFHINFSPYSNDSLFIVIDYKFTSFFQIDFDVVFVSLHSEEYEIAIVKDIQEFDVINFNINSPADFE